MNLQKAQKLVILADLAIFSRAQVAHASGRRNPECTPEIFIIAPDSTSVGSQTIILFPCQAFEVLMEVTPEKLQGACREVLGHDMVPWTLRRCFNFGV